MTPAQLPPKPLEQIPVQVIGAGSWGTTLAIHLARKGCPVSLWAHDGEQRQRLDAERENKKYLPGFPFPASIHVRLEEAPALLEGGTAILAVPSHGLRDVLASLARTRVGLWVVATKGLEPETCLRMSEVAEEVLPPDRSDLVTLSGPTLALEVMAGKPAAVLAASRHEEAANRTQALFANDRFRVYTSADPVGVELAGALKNVIALAAGIADGLELGQNARGALLTRGLAEMLRLGVALGAKSETFLGLAGVGDLVTTCTSSLSRNHSLGEAIGRGQRPEEARAKMSMVAEGVPTTRAALTLAERAGVELPIASQVSRILFEGVSPAAALRELMTRPLRPE